MAELGRGRGERWEALNVEPEMRVDELIAALQKFEGRAVVLFSKAEPTRIPVRVTLGYLRIEREDG